MDCGSLHSAFFQRIKLSATEGAYIIDKAGIVVLQERARGDSGLLLFLPVLDDLFLNPLSQRPGKGVESLPNDEALQGGDVNIAHVRAAIGASHLTNRILFERTGFSLVTLIYLS
jgi:hypothetical protein